MRYLGAILVATLAVGGCADIPDKGNHPSGWRYQCRDYVEDALGSPAAFSDERGESAEEGDWITIGTADVDGDRFEYTCETDDRGDLVELTGLD